MELVMPLHQTSQATVITRIAAAVVSALPPQAGMITASLAASHNSSHVILHPLLPLWKSETQKGISMVRPLLPGQEEDRGSPFCVRS